MTIKEIARRAGTSYSTVSRVLNKPDYRCSSSELEEKIRSIAMEENYMPDQAARVLKKKKENDKGNVWNIHILHTRIGENEADPYFAEIMRFITTELYQQNTILSNVWYMPQLRKDAFSRSSDIKIAEETIFRDVGENLDGIIVLGQCNQDVLIDLKQKFKAVLMVVRNGAQYEVDEIISEGDRSVRKAVEYLVSLGHKKIGYVGPCQMDENYLRVLKKHDIPYKGEFIFDGKRNEATGIDAINHFMTLEEKPTAIYFSNDIIAIGALRYLQTNKILSYKPSIISCDGIEQGQYTTPMLTTVEVQKDEIARLAVYVLLGRLNKVHQTPILLEMEGRLVIRDSCTDIRNVDGYCEYYI